MMREQDEHQGNKRHILRFRGRRRPDRGSWVSRMLLSYLPVFMIAAAILILVFFQTLSEQNREQTIQANRFVAKQALQMIDHSLKAIDQKITLEMLRNQDIQEYFRSGAEANLAQQVRIMNVMRDWVVSEPLLDSIYLVRYQDNSVLSVSTSYPLDRFPDRAFIAAARSAPNSGWSGVREYREFESEEFRRVVTLTRAASIFTFDKGLIVINVDTRALHGLISDLYDPALTYVNLYDREHRNLFSGISGAGNAENAGSADPPDEPLSVYVSDYSGWTIQSGILPSSSAFLATRVFQRWFLPAILVLLASAGWFIYLIVTNYRPIRNIVSRLEGLQENRRPPSEGHKHELHYIESALSDILDRAAQYEQQAAEDLAIKRNYFLYELLEGMRTIAPEEWEAEAARHGMEGPFGRQGVVLCEIDRYRSRFQRMYSFGDQKLLKYAVENVMTETFAKAGFEVWTLWLESHRMAVVVRDDLERGHWEARLREATRSAQEWIANHLRFTLSAGIGQAAEAPDQLRRSLREAKEALQFKPIRGENSLTFYSESAENAESKDRALEFFQMIRASSEAPRLAQADWVREVEEWFGQLRERKLAKDDIAGLLNYHVFYLDRSLADMGQDALNIWKREARPKLTEAIDEFETLDDLENSYLPALRSFAERLEEIRSSRHQRQLMREVRAYIQEQYTDPNLSLETLSDRFGLNGKYLSRLFKEEFGMRFIDYLIGLRMERAKTLLAETDMPVQEIAEKLGYTSAIAFARTFRREVGVSPSDYRKRYGGG